MTETLTPATAPLAPDAPVRKYGTFNSRMLASMFDVGFVLLLAVPVVQWLSDRLFAPMNLSALAHLQGLNLAADPEAGLKTIWKTLSEQQIIARSLFANFTQFFFLGCYIIPFWFRYSTTPGKMLLRLEIIDEATGHGMSRRQAVERYLSYLVSALPLTLGFGWMLFNKKHRGFHDMLAHTVVVVKQKKKKIRGTA